MRLHVGIGVWEIFIPGIGEGEVYKYEIVGPDGQVYAPFMFYYDRSSADPNLPVADDNYARELQRVVTPGPGRNAGPYRR